MKARRRWIDYTQYLAVRLVAMVLGMFSLEVALRAMRWVGGVWFALPQALPETRIPGPIARLRFMGWSVRLSNLGNTLLHKFRQHRLRAEDHVRASFPNLTASQVSAIARSSMEQMAMLGVEVLMTPRQITPWTWCRYIRLRQMDEALRVLLSGKGCIMLTGHYGNWELLGYTLAVLGFDIVAVMRPLDNPYINRYLLEQRERSGLTLLEKKGASRSAAGVLEDGGALCFIADQDAGRKGLFVDFLGRPASTYKSIGLLAMEYEVPIVVGCARRIGSGFSYEVRADRIIRPEEWQGRDDPLLWITQAFTRALESFILDVPGQYLWIHRRWKSKPKARRMSGSATPDCAAREIAQ